ncbi:MAG: cell envelope integrity protein TolA [Clostridia bacterium]|jgi:hypothetical protein|nr:cell envelope integrity protein TolA [Clostridia bacterium]
MENVFTPQKKNNISMFTIFMIFVIFFTTSDLVANVTQEPIWVSLFSILSGFFVFLGTALKKKQNIEKGINAKIDYINNNFGWGAVVLSTLDIICSLIAIFTTLVALGVIFRSLFALRLIITINKVKLLVQSVLLAIVGYLTLRFENIKLNFKESKMKSFFKKIWKGIVAGFKYVFVSNPQASLATLGNAFLSATIGYTASIDTIIAGLPSYIGIDIVPVAISILLFIIVQVFGIRWAFETNSTADERKTITSAEKEKIALAKAEKKALEAQAKKVAEDKKKALALAQKKQDEANAKIAEQQEEARLLAIAAKMKADEEAKKIAETKVEVIVETPTDTQQ